MAISQVEQVPVGELRLNPTNVRKHSKKQISQLAEIIRQVGFLVPIIADEKRVVQAGNGRLLAAREIGLRSVPVITASGLSDAKRRAYVVADNKIAQGARTPSGPMMSVDWDRAEVACSESEEQLLTHMRHSTIGRMILTYSIGGMVRTIQSI